MGDSPGDAPDATTIRTRAADVIERQRDKMRRNLGAAIDGRDPEGVHDMRVASRRLRAALAVFEPWLDRRELAHVGRSVRRITRALGRVRELDVLRLRLAKLAERASGERKLAIEIIDSRLARARLRARARMMKAFAAVDLDELDTRLRELAGSPPAWAVEGAEASGLDAGVPWKTQPGDEAPDEPIETLLARLGPEVAQEARDIVDSEIPGDVGSQEASTALHAVRIRAKKLRYQLEILAPHAGAAADTLIDTLKSLQEHLGEFHDDAVLDEVLAESIARQAARARPLLVAELRRLRAGRRAALRRDERACRGALAGLRVGRFAERAAGLFAPPAETPPQSDTDQPPPQSEPDESPPQNETDERLGHDLAGADTAGRGGTFPPEARPVTTRYAGEPVRKSPPHAATASRPDAKVTARAAAVGPSLPGSDED